MSTVKVGENESIDNALRRFKRKCARDGIIGDLRKREAYEKPSVKRKKKAEAPHFFILQILQLFLLHCIIYL